MTTRTCGDMAVVALAYSLAWYVRFRSPLMGAWLPGADSPEAYWYAAPVVLGVFWLVFKYLGLYRGRRSLSAVDAFSKLVQGTVASLVVLSGLAFFDRQFPYSIKVFLLTAGGSLVGLLAWRIFMHWMASRAWRRGMGVARTVLVGSGPLAAKLAARAHSNPGAGYRIIGLVDNGPGARKAAGAMGLPLLGGLDDLCLTVRHHQADCVILALPASRRERTERILRTFTLKGVDLRVVSDLHGLVTSPLAVDEIHGIPVFALREAPLDRQVNRILKRTLDLVVAGGALVVLTPLLLAIAAVVKLDSPGPVFYKQERIGKKSRPFKMFKFRTMRVGSDKGATWTVKDDPRRTRSGSFLRRTSLDELPQLFNIIRGDMSLVGPRPEQPQYVAQFAKTIPRYLERHKVQAGLTGWAQVHGWRGDTSIEERTTFDLFYVENWSFSLDLLILFRTAVELFEQETAY